MDKRTFTFLGVRYTAPASMDENIRDWFARNAPTAACDLVPADARFSTVHAALTPSTAAPLPAWCASIDSTARNLIYYCVAAAARRIVQENGENKKKHSFLRKNVCFSLQVSRKVRNFAVSKRKRSNNN